MAPNVRSTSSRTWLSAFSLALSISLSTFPQPATALPSDVFAPFSPAWVEYSSEDAILSFNSSSSSAADSDNDNDTLLESHHDLLRRANGCPSNYNVCSALSASGVCCSSNAVCSLDAASQVACCPLGSYCTGTISSASKASTATTTATATGTYVSNAYFPFPYVSTSFNDAGACSTASSECASYYAACTADLAGANYGVTISAPNGGVTVAAASASIGYSSATSVCASLSQAAGCAATALSSCGTYTGSATATTGAGGVVTVTVTSTSGFTEGSSAAAPGVATPGFESWAVVGVVVVMAASGMMMI